MNTRASGYVQFSIGGVFRLVAYCAIFVTLACWYHDRNELLESNARMEAGMEQARINNKLLRQYAEFAQSDVEGLLGKQQTRELLGELR